MKISKNQLVSATLICVLFTLAHAVPTPEEKPKATVMISKIKMGELFDRLTYPARAVARVNATLLAETDGVVSVIHTGLGKHVTKGQPILTITHTDPVYQYAPAQVLSSVAGIVSSLDVSEGTQVSHGQRIGAVTDPGQIRLIAEIPAQDFSAVHTGLQGELTISGADKPWTVKVRGVSPYVDPGTGTATCELELLRNPMGLRSPVPGELGQVAFKTSVRKGINIPDYAIIYKGDTPYVRLLDGKKAKRVAVKMGAKQRGYVEILDGLKENSILIERVSRFVADGEEVSAQNPEAIQ